MRSARVVVLLVLYLLFTGMALAFFSWAAHQITEQANQKIAQLEQSAREQGASPEDIAEARKKIDDAMAEQRKEFIKTFLSNDEAMAEALAAIPLVLLIVFKMTLRFLPLYMGIMGFDQISGEVGPRSIRYLTVRSRRSSVLLGKYLAQATLLAILMFVVDLTLCVYARATTPDFTTGAMFATFARFWVSAIIFSLAYLALTTLCSALFRTPAVSLVTNIIALFVLWLVAFIGEAFPLEGTRRLDGTLESTTSPGAYLRYASVWHYNSDLLHPQLSHASMAALAHLGFAAAFLLIAWAILRRRDL